MPSQTRNDSDHDMPDAPVNGNSARPADEPISQDVHEADLATFEQRLRVLPGDSLSAASFEFTNEDHTLGNALRYVIMKNPDVEFCGYSIPHPSDPKMNIRIQTYDEVSVYDVLEKGLNDLMDLCDVVLDKFEDARNRFPKAPASEPLHEDSREP